MLLATSKKTIQASKNSNRFSDQIVDVGFINCIPMSKNTHIHEKNNQPVGFGGMQALGIQVQLWVIGIYGYGSLLWFLTYTAGLTSGLHWGSQLGCRAGWAAGPAWPAQACTLDRTAFSNLLIMSIDLCLVSRNYFVVYHGFIFRSSITFEAL